MVAEAVVHVLELVEIDVQGRSSCALSPAAGQELLNAVHDQGPVRQAGQRVVHRLMTQFVGLLTHDAQCPCAPGAHHEHQRSAEQAQGDSCDQQCKRVATCEHPAGSDSTVGRDRPAIVQVDRRRLSADRRPATLERHARSPDVVVEYRHRVRVALQRRVEYELGRDRHSNPAEKRCPPPSDGGRHRASPIHRSLNGQIGIRTELYRGVGAITRITYRHRCGPLEAGRT